VISRLRSLRRSRMRRCAAEPLPRRAAIDFLLAVAVPLHERLHALIDRVQVNASLTTRGQTRPCGVHCPKLKRKPNEPRPANAENRRLSFGSNNDLRPASNFFEGHEAGAYECLTRGSSTSLKGNIACEKSRALRCVRAVGGCGRREPKTHPRHAETLSG
jgi:hypothetical protein